MEVGAWDAGCAKAGGRFAFSWSHRQEVTLSSSAHTTEGSLWRLTPLAWGDLTPSFPLGWFCWWPVGRAVLVEPSRQKQCASLLLPTRAEGAGGLGWMEGAGGPKRGRGMGEEIKKASGGGLGCAAGQAVV